LEARCLRRWPARATFAGSEEDVCAVFWPEPIKSTPVRDAMPLAREKSGDVAQTGGGPLSLGITLKTGDEFEGGTG
jgi:hypothetical protein